MRTPGEAMTDVIPPVIASALGPGSIIAGRYRLQARLGTGGGGTVWRCLDDKLGAVVALKIVSSDGDLERWRREVAMARRIANRNVCRVHDLGETAELRYVTMEWVEGDSLRGRISRDLPAAAARDLFAQVVAGTAAIHAAGIVHRDLKPENIVVARDGRAVIVDFGLAREPRAAGAAPDGGRTALDAGARTVPLRGPAEPAPPSPPGATVTDPGAVVGTPRYMSPEQAAGQPVDARTDVWALGLIGHELLAGTLPLPDEHGRRVDPAVDAKWPGAASVLRRCLGFLPEERLSDARQLALALSVLGRRRWGVRVAVAALLAAGIAGGFVAASSVMRDEPSHPVAPAPPRMFQVTTTAPKKWPGDAPISVALAPDASQLAYTTGDGRLLVRPLASGMPVAWSIPSLDKRSRTTDAPEPLVTVWVVGWFGDGSIALLGTDRDGHHQLYRVHRDGRAELLYRHAQPFTAAVTSVGDRVAVAISDHAVFVVPTAGDAGPDQIAPIERDEQVLALAWSPDGTRIAVARLPAEAREPASIRVMSASGSDVRDVWRGPLTALAGQLLAWLDADRLVFASNDLVTGRAQLITVDVRDRASQQRDAWADTYAAGGSAARGTLLVLRGTASYAVQIGDHAAWHLARVHSRGPRSHRLAGWTSDQQAVFAVGGPGKERIVRAAPGQALVSWPGTRDGVDRPDTLAGEDLIVHRLDDASRQLVVERITPAGEHTELARVAADPMRPAETDVVRCAGDRAAPCIVEDSDGRVVSWTELDPRTGSRGARIHQRPIRARAPRSAAVSPDGRTVAVVDGGNTVTLIDRTTGEESSRSAGEGAALQSVGFSSAGDVWAAAVGFKGRMFGLLTFEKLGSGRISTYASTRGSARDDVLRWFGRPRPSPDGKRVAVTTLELGLEVWRADDL